MVSDSDETTYIEGVWEQSAAKYILYLRDVK
jgi:hypothetical protein